MTKLHGLGNDFLVVVDETAAGPRPDAAFAVEVCARHTGVGADGLILATVDPSDSTAVTMTLWNADGSMAEISGNGIRCLGHAIARHRSVDDLELTVTTGAGLRRLAVTGGTLPEASVRTEMGSVVVAEVDVSGEVRAVVAAAGRVATASVGNPHVVVEVPDPSLIDLATAGPAIEARLGPINVEFIAVDGGARRIDLTVWERGVGITQACGSGAVAAATVASGWNGSTGPVTVAMPGGIVTVEPADPAILTGPSVVIADVDVAWPRESAPGSVDHG
ncbi:MAG: diaminopimelate epimerase [Acidimicrobiales bacterium]